MDQYGQCYIEDASEIARSLHKNKQIFFTFAPDKTTAFAISIHYVKNVIGRTIGGDPLDRFMVSLPFTGSSFHFDLYDPEEFHPNYIAEKLMLGDYGANAVCRILNALKKEMAPLKEKGLKNG